jgi:hypothetical protein
MRVPAAWGRCGERYHAGCYPAVVHKESADKVEQPSPETSEQSRLAAVRELASLRAPVADVAEMKRQSVPDSKDLTADVLPIPER